LSTQEAEVTIQNKRQRIDKKKNNRNTKSGKGTREKDDSEDEEFDPKEIDEGYFDD
jgi:hypothetical protein